MLLAGPNIACVLCIMCCNLKSILHIMRYRLSHIQNILPACTECLHLESASIQAVVHYMATCLDRRHSDIVMDVHVQSVPPVRRVVGREWDPDKVIPVMDEVCCTCTVFRALISGI